MSCGGCPCRLFQTLFEILSRFECVFWRSANRAFFWDIITLINVATAQAYPVFYTFLRSWFFPVFLGRFNGWSCWHKLPGVECPFRCLAYRAFVRRGGSLINIATAYAYPVIETLCCHSNSPFFTKAPPEHPLRGEGVLLFNDNRLSRARFRSIPA